MRYLLFIIPLQAARKQRRRTFLYATLPRPKPTSPVLAGNQGQRVSSRVEGDHAKLKLHLISSQSRVLTLVEASTAIFKDYGRQVTYTLSTDRPHVPIRLQKETIFSDIVREIAGKALGLVCERLPEP